MLAELRRLRELHEAAAKPKKSEADEAKERAQKFVEQIKPFTVDAAMLEQLGFPEATEAQIKGFQKFINETSAMSVRAANLLAEQRMQQLVERFAPVEDYIQEQHRENVKRTFFNSYPGLTKYENLVAMVAKQVSPVKPDGGEKTPQEIFDEVAATTVAHAQSIGVNLTLEQVKTATSSAGQATNSAVPKPASGMRPGQSQSQQQPQPKNPQADIWS